MPVAALSHRPSPAPAAMLFRQVLGLKALQNCSEHRSLGLDLELLTVL